MATDYMQQLEQLDKPWFFRLAWAGGAFLFILAGYLWWNYASINPERVFWGTVSNNLVITGVTKHTVTDQQDGSMDQYQQISLGAQNVVKSEATIDQKAIDAASTNISTETIATPTVDYSRYTKIKTEPKAGTTKTYDFSSALNIWSKQSVEESGNGAFGEALYGILPFSLLQSKDRNQIVAQMKQNKAYTVDYSKVVKHSDKGRLIYDYTVSVDAQQYVAALKAIDKANGLNQLQSVDPSQYSGSQPVEVKVSIDAHAQQLVSIAYPNNSRTETYSAYGVFNGVPIPDKAISQSELQDKLNGILNAQ